MTDTLNKFSSEELCQFLGVDLRSILSTKGFPKPNFDGRRYFFDKKKVLKYFNVDNFDEGFISLKDAADYLGINQARLMALTKNNEVPNYRLKSTKGSGYLFRKSELDKIKDVQIEGNVNFVNYFIGTHHIKELFQLFVEKHYKQWSTSREYEVIILYFFDRVDFIHIADKFDLTVTRVRQIFERGCRRMKNMIYNLSPEEIYKKEKEIIKLTAEVNYLKKFITIKNPELKTDVDRSEEVKQLCEAIIQFGDKRLSDELSVRALNCLRDINIHTVYDLIKEFKFEDGSINQLLKLRNFGKHTFDEVRDYIEIKNKEFKSMTGFTPYQLLRKPSYKTSEQDLFIRMVRSTLEQYLKIDGNDNKEN